MTYGNPSFLKKWGFDDPKEFFGKPFWEFWLVKDRFDEIMQSLQGKDPGSVRLRRDGKMERFSMSRCQPPWFLIGKVIRALTSTSIDITNRKQAEEALRQARDELELRVKERTTDLVKRSSELETQIAKREQFEKALRGSTEKLIEQLQQRKQLSAKLVELPEKDRHDTGMVIHDQVGSILTGAKIEIEAIEAERP